MQLSAISLAITALRAQGGAAPAYDPRVVFGSDLVTYYGNSVDELFAEHRKAWEDSPELVTNGRFDTDLSGWTVDSGTSATWVDGSMQFTTQVSQMRQTISGLPVGSVVRISWRQTILGGTRSRVRVRNLASNNDLLFNYYSGTQVATISVVLTDGGLNLVFLSEVADTFQIRDVSVRVIDPTKLRLYQDSAGTTPVTAVEQFVGLVLDQSQGLELGPQLFSGTFAATNAPWVASGSGSWSINGSQGANTDLQSSGNVGPADGKFCEWKLTVSGLASGSLAVYLGSVTPIALGNGTHRLLLPRNAVTFIIRASAGQTATVSGISVRELPGNHLSQPTATARSRLTRQVNLRTNTPNFAGWALTNAALTSVGDSPDGPAWRLTPTGTSGGSVRQSAATLVGDRLKHRVLAKADTGSFLFLNNDGVSSSGTWFDLTLGTVVSSQAASLNAQMLDRGDGWWECSIETVAASTGGGFLTARPTVSGVSSAVSPDYAILVSAPDSRFTAFAAPAFPPYQRVTSDTDYDEVGFPALLRFDGTDDHYVSGNIDLTSTNKLSVVTTAFSRSTITPAAVWALSNAPWSTVGAARHYANNNEGGSLTPGALMATLRGTSERGKSVADVTYPFVSAVQLDGELSGSEVSLRVNGVVAGGSPADSGLTAFGNNPLYVGGQASANRLNGGIFALPMIVKRLMTPGELAAAEKAFGKSIGVLQ